MLKRVFDRGVHLAVYEALEAIRPHLEALDSGDSQVYCDGSVVLTKHGRQRFIRLEDPAEGTTVLLDDNRICLEVLVKPSHLAVDPEGLIEIVNRKIAEIPAYGTELAAGYAEAVGF